MEQLTIKDIKEDVKVSPIGIKNKTEITFSTFDKEASITLEGKGNLKVLTSV